MKNQMKFQNFSNKSDARIIWGGDKTINQFKFNTSPNCLDITFPDRYSLAILGSDDMIKLNDSILRDS